MTFTLLRDKSTPAGMFGLLDLNGVYFCRTLEPEADRATFPAIPAGRYAVVINYSTRFKRLLPLIIGVPGRLGVRIHPGNVSADTEGCVLLGSGREGNRLTDSVVACNQFLHTIQPALDARQDVILIIKDAV